MLLTLEPRLDAGHLVAITAIGVCGSAQWRGKTPLLDAVEMDVELEVPETLTWDDIVVDGAAGDCANLNDEELLLDGIVEGVDDAGVLVLRVGGGLVLIDTISAPQAIVNGRRVSLVVRAASVFPTNI